MVSLTKEKAAADAVSTGNAQRCMASQYANIIAWIGKLKGNEDLILPVTNPLRFANVYAAGKRDTLERLFDEAIELARYFEQDSGRLRGESKEFSKRVKALRINDKWDLLRRIEPARWNERYIDPQKIHAGIDALLEALQKDVDSAVGNITHAREFLERRKIAELRAMEVLRTHGAGAAQYGDRE